MQLKARAVSCSPPDGLTVAPLLVPFAASSDDGNLVLVRLGGSLVGAFPPTWCHLTTPMGIATVPNQTQLGSVA